jgi:hypothetical protein
MRVALCGVLVALSMPGLMAQIPTSFNNLQYFSKDITRQQLLQRMREFSFALDVRCQHCHSGGDGVSFDGVNFASDDKPAKVKARAMLRMVDQLNNTMLASLPSRAEPRVDVNCTTCHRGLALPKTLQKTMIETVDKEGAAAAVAKYRQLRQDTVIAGKYNFGEWEINEAARQLTDAGKTAEAIALLEMNGEFYPKSADIDFTLGELHRGRKENDKAISRYRAVLEKNPQHQGAKRWITQLTTK